MVGQDQTAAGGGGGEKKTVSREENVGGATSQGAERERAEAHLSSNLQTGMSCTFLS